MLPRTPGLILLLAALSASSAGFPCHAQQAQPSQPIRYHFGDDADGKLGWANPNFDDRTWPTASDGRIPAPAFYSDGFVWVRVRLPVPQGITGPLAIRQVNPENAPSAEELYVGGRLVGRNGRVPPHPVPMAGQGQAVFPLASEAVSGNTVTVALRAWIHPAYWALHSTCEGIFEIDRESVLAIGARDHKNSLLLEHAPELVLFGALFVVGLGLLLLWRITRREELALFGLSLITIPGFVGLMSLTEIGLLPLPIRSWDLMYGPLQTLSPAVAVVFLWVALALPGRKWMYLILGVTIAGGFCVFLSYWVSNSRSLTSGLLSATLAAAMLREVSLMAIIGWSIVRRPSNRLFTCLLALPLLFFALWLLGVTSMGLFYLSLLVYGYAVAAMLVQRAWKGWCATHELRLEFEAAREVQQQLVVPAVDVPGFRIESAYVPAKQVGGDFFRLTPEGGGGVLIVVGDVSGKGLSAAMTVSAVIGALRSIPPVSPAWILNALNSGLVGQLHGGFVTCCAARIAPDGAATIANAGHLSPYLAGAELPVAPGLPLGLLAGAEYEESHFQLHPGQPLTFLSDGVIEARNAAGELFGFDRTQAISTESAAEIAKTAELFGQEDDITVLTLALTPPQKEVAA